MEGIKVLIFTINVLESGSISETEKLKEKLILIIRG